MSKETDDRSPEDYKKFMQEMSFLNGRLSAFPSLFVGGSTDLQLRGFEKKNWKRGDTDVFFFPGGWISKVPEHNVPYYFDRLAETACASLEGKLERENNSYGDPRTAHPIRQFYKCTTPRLSVPVNFMRGD